MMRILPPCSQMISQASTIVRRCLSGGMLEREQMQAVVEENRIDKEWAIRQSKSPNSLPLWTVGAASDKEQYSPRDMGDYIRSRGYSGTADPSSMRMLSSMLTYPLSLGYSINHIFGDKLKSINVTVVGARKESSLPDLWWADTLRTCKHDKIEVRMVGPGLQRPQHTQRIIMQSAGGISKELITKYGIEDACGLHDHPALMSILLQTNVFVLFNPGLGSAPLKHVWKPTLELLLSTKKPIVCTCHGEHDLSRDLSAISEFLEDPEDYHGDPLEFLLRPQTNPFRSLDRAVDLNEIPGAMVLNCNHSIYAFRAQQ